MKEDIINIVGLLDELCDKLDKSGIEGNVIERDSNGRPYVSIWYGKFEDRLRQWPPERFTVVITDYSFYFNPNGCYEIKPPEKYRDYFKDTFMACTSRISGFYVMGSDQIVRTIKFLFNREKMEKKKENNMDNTLYKVSDMSVTTSSVSQDEITLTVKPFGLRSLEPSDCTRIKEAIESISETKKWCYILCGRGNGKTRVLRDTVLREMLKNGMTINDDIKDVIFNNPATIVLWSDGTKTVVKAENEEFDPEKGLAMAIAKKALGNNYGYYDVFKKYVGRYEKKQKKGGK